MASEFQRLKTTQFNYSAFMGATTIGELEYDRGVKSASFFSKAHVKNANKSGIKVSETSERSVNP